MRVIKTVAISQEQQDYIELECLNFSKFVRKCLDVEMKDNVV